MRLFGPRFCGPRAASPLFALFACLVLAACGDRPTTNNGETNNGETNNGATNNGFVAPATGEQVYSQRLERGNTFTCSTCHALTEPADDGITRPGHPIGDAFGRPSYKNGKVTELRDAVNSCITEWMAGDAWADDDESWILLRDWLEDMSPPESETLTFEIGEPPADLTGGDPEAGRELFNTSCVVCHGMDAAGTEKAPPLGGTMLDPAYIAERVRKSGNANSAVYEGLSGGVMPFWAPDRITDPQLLDIVAFVSQAEAVEPTNNGTTNNENNQGMRSCESTHAKVGQSLTFDTKFHGVRGTATIVDDCTIQVTNFFFDGNGIEVRFYGSLGGDYRNGFPIGPDLYNFPTGYEDATLRVQLPMDKTLDDVDGLSVWCVAAGISFGDGLFE